MAYPSYDSLVALAAAGAVTDRIGLFTNILLAPTRNPALLAKEAASVDQISGGRLTLGLAVGSRKDDFEATGRSFEDRGARFDRDLDVLHRAWRGDLVDGAGKPVTPSPVRGEGVPILFGGMSDRTIERVVRWGVGWTAGGAPLDQTGPFIERVRAAWRDAGREGEPRIVCLSYYSVGEGTEEESAANLRDYYGYLGEWADAIAQNAPRTPERIRETVEGFAALGVDELVFDPTVPDVAQVDLLADLVL